MVEKPVDATARLGEMEQLWRTEAAANDAEALARGQGAHEASYERGKAFARRLCADMLASAISTLASNDKCSGCGGPYRFDTSVPSAVWNAVIRKASLSEFLCTTCIIEAFVKADRSFTATLCGAGFNLVPITVEIRNRPALDAVAVSEENNTLRCRVRELEAEIAEFSPLRARQETTDEHVAFERLERILYGKVGNTWETGKANAVMALFRDLRSLPPSPSQGDEKGEP